MTIEKLFRGKHDLSFLSSRPLTCSHRSWPNNVSLVPYVIHRYSYRAVCKHLHFLDTMPGGCDAGVSEHFVDLYLRSHLSMSLRACDVGSLPEFDLARRHSVRKLVRVFRRRQVTVTVGEYDIIRLISNTNPGINLCCSLIVDEHQESKEE